MKKFIFLIISVLFSCMFFSCLSEGDKAQLDYERKAKASQYMTEYAKTVNNLEFDEGNFNSYRRIVFYNVRLGETVFSCEGYAHIQIDRDGDIEIVLKSGENSYLRHYLGQKQDITYFSEQIKPSDNLKSYNYKISWNPKLWIPEVFQKLE
ncbi:hypothetical protein [Treponema sp.]|uniref:beta-sandwich lipoprotein n=1 Tax=Treponema sp. TaxID=166 RepID=UPI0025F30F01|nr:hypothetical protein [Treponema sp.]MCR5219209.1 hypothetical protein [Treponema sp.]